jgi:signal transduction histidine kinase
LIVPQGSSKTFEAVVDAFLMTVIVAPVIWFTVVRPIELLSRSRMLFLRRSMIAQESERRRIKQELHDGLGQTLTSMLLGLRAIEETSSDPKVVEIIHQLRPIGASIHDDLRRIVSGLHPAILDQGGLVDAVSQLIDQLRLASKANFHLNSKGVENKRFDRNYETLVYRIIQESLNNAVKHSEATEIHVELELEGQSALKIRVNDNGRGFAPRVASGTQTSYGLIGLRERALAVGGHIEITSGKSGTTVSAVLPGLKEEEQLTS